MLLNPHRRKRKHSTKTRARRTHRRTRRNPRFSMKSLFRKKRRTVARRTRKVHRRRRSRRNVLIPSALLQMNPRKHRKRSRRMTSRRRTHRRRSRRNPLNLGGITSSFKNVLSKDLVMTAGGALAATAATGYAVNMFGPFTTVSGVRTVKSSGFVLPFTKSTSSPDGLNHWGVAAYSIVVGALGSYLLKGFNRNLAEGFAIGGLVSAVNEGITAINLGKSATAGTAGFVGEYFPNKTIRKVGIGAPPGGGTPGYNAINAFGRSPGRGMGATPQAFQTSAWHN